MWSSCDKIQIVIARQLLPLLAISIASAQQLPRFEDYPAKEVFTGTPAAPILVTPQQRRYRTRIREGVAKRAGVWRDGQEQPGINFAGHYIIIEWGCGSPCVMNAIVDAVTGKIYNPPISHDLALPNTSPGDPMRCLPSPATLKFRLNSSLMIVDASPNLSNDKNNYTHYFLWENNQWRLLRKVPLTPCAPNTHPNPDH
jgi:hypothetical protein